MKKFQLLKWTAEVREKELQFLFFNGHSVDLLDDSNPTVIFETESESEAYNYLEKESDGDVVECEYLDIRYPEGE